MSLFNGPSNNNKSSNNNINNFQKSPNNTANKQILDHSRSTSPSSGAEDCSTASSLCTASSTGSSGHGSSNRNTMPQSVAGLPKTNPLAPVFHPRQHYEHNTNNNNNTLSVLSEEGSSLTPTAGSAKMNNFQPTSGSSTPPSMASLPHSMHRENNAQSGQCGVQRTQVQVSHLQNSNSHHQSQMEQNFGQTQNFGGQSQNNNNFGQFVTQTQAQRDAVPHNQNQGQTQQHQDQNQMVQNMSQNMTPNMSQIDQNAYNFQRNSNNSASFAQQNQFRPNQLNQNQLNSQSQANINVQEAQQNSINFYQNNGLQNNNSVPAQLSNFMNKRDSQNSLYKTEQCRSFGDTGSCRYGNKCQFAHGTEEVRNLSRHPKYKTEMCRSYHTTGHCPYSTRCHFIHELSQRGQRIEDGPPVRRGGRNQTSPNVRDMGATNPNFGQIGQNMAGNGGQMGQMHQAQSQSMGQHMGHLAVGQGQQANSNMWSVGGVSMADRMKNSNSNVTISHESSNRFESSGVFTQNSSNCWNNSNNVVNRQDSNNDSVMFDSNFRTPVKFDMGWNENKNENKVDIQAKKEAEINSWGSGFGNSSFATNNIQGSGDNNQSMSYNKNSGFNGTLDWGKSASKPASYEKPKSQSSIFGSESIFSNPSSNTKINTSGGQSTRFDTTWSTNVEANCEKKMSSERTPSSSIFDQNNNPMEDEFSFNDIFNQMSVQDKSKQVVQGGSSGQGECSIFGGGVSLFDSNKRVNNSTSTSSNRSQRLPVFQELTDNV